MKFLFAAGADVAISVYTWTRRAEKTTVHISRYTFLPSACRAGPYCTYCERTKKKAYKLKCML